MSNLKVCCTCKNLKPLDSFSKLKKSTDGYQNRCRSCASIKNKIWRQQNIDKVKLNNGKWAKNNPERAYEGRKRWREQNLDRSKKVNKNSWLKRAYGITLDKYNEMLEFQQNKCKICNENKKLVVDHCHKTGKVRGLICDKCNVGLGRFNDDLNLILKAAEYLNVYLRGG